MTLLLRHAKSARVTHRLPLRVALVAPAALGMSLVTSAGAGAAVIADPAQSAGVEVDVTTAAVSASSMTVTVQSPGATYVSSSSTDRPVLKFSGWQDAQGQPLSSMSVPVQVRLVASDGSAQSATIYPVFTNGCADYTLPLWPFTQATDPHVDTFTMQWRQASGQEWQTIDTFTVDIRLPEAAPGATLDYVNGTLTGTGWTFGRSTNIGGTFKIALDVTDPDGHTESVAVLADFTGRQFTVSAEALAAAGVTLRDGCTVSATTTGGAAPIVVSISDAGGSEPTTEPSVEPTTEPSAEATAQPSAIPSPVATPESSAAPTAEPTGQPSPEATTSATPTPQPTPTTTNAPTTAAETPTPAPTTRASAATDRPEAQATSAPSSAGTGTSTNPTNPTSEFDALNEGIDVDPLVVPDSNTPSIPDSSAPSVPAPAAGAVDADTSVDPLIEAAAVDEAARPSTLPVSPVQDPEELGPDNAGSLSGTREGTAITLFFPSAKVKEGDWVAVFVYPGATTGGWVQVDADNSVSLDISTLEPGSYKIAVGDRDSDLLGWAQLEISEATEDEVDEAASVTLVTGEDLADGSALGADGWKFVGAAGLLVIGAAAFVLLAVPTFGDAKTRVRGR